MAKSDDKSNRDKMKATPRSVNARVSPDPETGEHQICANSQCTHASSHLNYCSSIIFPKGNVFDGKFGNNLNFLFTVSNNKAEHSSGPV